MSDWICAGIRRSAPHGLRSKIALGLNSGNPPVAWLSFEFLQWLVVRIPSGTLRANESYEMVVVVGM